MKSVGDKSWHDYLAKIKRLPHWDILEKAVALLPEGSTNVVDCGCGVGNNSQYLIDKGLDVHAFDKDANAVNVCRMRFINQAKYSVCLSNLDSFIYPPTGLVVASTCFFFCNPQHFANCWHNLSQSIQAGGVFCGDFLGLDDTWERQGVEAVIRFSEAEIKRLFSSFEIIEWHEKNTTGNNISGQKVNRHTHTLLVRKYA